MVLVCALDIGLTVLHPTIQGPLSHRLTRRIWRLIRGLALLLRAPRLLIFAGPMATVALLFAWLAGLWIGFAVLYLPFVDHFSSSVHFSHKGIFAALYTSATMLTTHGLGDLLPTQDGMRVAVVCEAAAGVATVSAAISYILSVYPLATQNRARALYLADLQLNSPTAATEYLTASGDSGLAEIHQRLIDGTRASAASRSSTTFIPTTSVNRSNACSRARPSCAPWRAGRRRSSSLDTGDASRTDSSRPCPGSGTTTRPSTSAATPARSGPKGLLRATRREPCKRCNTRAVSATKRTSSAATWRNSMPSSPKWTTCSPGLRDHTFTTTSRSASV